MKTRIIPLHQPANARQAAVLLLLPAPRKLSPGGGVLRVKKGSELRVDPAFGPGLLRHIRTFGRTHGTPLLRIVRRPGLPAQGYRLSIRRDGAELSASDEAGAFYGLQTLRQIAEQRGMGWPVLEIEDQPDFANRGVLLDISRNKVPKLETLFALVDLFAGWKINQLQLYTEHTFAYSAHRRVWQGYSPMTARDIRRLDLYCRERYVELVPNQNSFGHARPWLRHDEYRRLAECPRGTGRFDHGFQFRADAATLRFLDGLYAELLPNFSSRQFHIGCDETKELGLGASRRRVARDGRIAVYLDFLLRIDALVRRHGRRSMFWADMILEEPRLIPRLRQGMTAMVWGYDADHPFARQCRPFADAGIPFYVCPGASTSRTSFGGNTENCLSNQWNAARAGLAAGAVGLLNTDWGDGGHIQHLPVSYPGFAMGAALSWRARANRDLDWAGALDRHAFHDTAGRMGRIVLDMGRVQDRIGFGQKGSPLGYAFSARTFGPEFTGHARRAALEECVERLVALEKDLVWSNSTAPDGALLQMEIRNTLSMMRHAARRGLAALGAAAPALRDERLELLREHASIWRARNRPGGYRWTVEGLRRPITEGFVHPLNKET